MKRLTLLASVLLTIAATSVQAQNENLEENSDLLESSGKYQKAIELDRGQDFGEELRQAFLLFKEAADEGNIDAAYRVATMYREGRGISINFVESEKYLKFSAYSGQVDSQIMLASKYMESGNIEEAYLLAILGKALANSQPQFDESNQLLEQISSQIDEQDINRLQRHAANCIDNGFSRCTLTDFRSDENLTEGENTEVSANFDPITQQNNPTGFVAELDSIGAAIKDDLQENLASQPAQPMPKLLFRPSLPYPRTNRSGWVLADFDINPSGRVIMDSVIFLESHSVKYPDKNNESHHLIEKTTLLTLEGSQYQTRLGKSVESSTPRTRQGTELFKYVNSSNRMPRD